MQLEQVIKQQKAFNNQKHKLLVNILYSQSWLSLHIDSLFKVEEVTVQQYNILRILRGQYPKAATVNLLIERMLDKMSNASRLVDKLYNKGYVTRNRNKKDRRAVDVVITKKGLKFLDKMSPQMNLLEQSLYISESEAKQLNDLLDKMRGREEL